MEMKELWRWRNDRGGAIMKLTELFKWRDYGRRGVMLVTNSLIHKLLRIVSSISNHAFYFYCCMQIVCIINNYSVSAQPQSNL